FDLAHRALTGDAGVRNVRGAGESKRAIILIAPFPDSKEPAAYKEPAGFLGLAASILNSLTTQVRFNPEELILASDPNVFSRFLISPKRDNSGTGTPRNWSKQSNPPGVLEGDIACGT